MYIIYLLLIFESEMCSVRMYNGPMRMSNNKLLNKLGNIVQVPYHYLIETKFIFLWLYFLSKLC